MNRKKLKEYTGQGHLRGGGRTVAPRMDHPHSDKLFKVKSAVATFPYIHIDDVDENDLMDLQNIYDGMDFDNEEFSYPFEGHEDGESFEKRNEISPSAGGPGIGILKTPSKAVGGGSNQNMPAGMNSPGWASSPRNTEKSKKENDYIKDFLLKFDI